MSEARADITALLRQGLTNTAVARELGCDRHLVGDVRRSLGIPHVDQQPLTLEQKWESLTRPVDGGHREWLGERAAGGTPVMRYRGNSYSPAALAFRMKHGRDADAYVRADCGMPHCVAPDHVDDTAARHALREQLRYLTGRGERPEQCAHGHAQAEHGRYEADGRAYCEKCKRERKAKS